MGWVEIHQPGGSRMSGRIGSTELADESLHRQKATRQRLAGSIKTALLAAERLPSPPAARRAQFDFEKEVLRQALNALLRLPPPIEQKMSVVDREIETSTRRSLEEELEWSR